MTPARLRQLARRYASLRLALVGDFCLDRYLEIDPARRERSIETGLPVHNVVRVRSQPGGAGTILNNLVALGVGHIHLVGFHGEDGEGWELRRSLRRLRGVDDTFLLQTPLRHTFTYAKPLLLRPGRPPRELSRLDTKNWTPTPPSLQSRLSSAVRQLAGSVDAMILLDQVDRAGTGVVTAPLLATVAQLARRHPRLLILADSRRGLRGYPAVAFKMNAAELASLTRSRAKLPLAGVRETAARLARRHRRHVFVTLAGRGIVGADPHGATAHAPALPRRGPIDIVGAGDAVTANLVTALAADATLTEALILANTAASVVIHQLGTTGTASVAQIGQLLPAVDRRSP